MKIAFAHPYTFRIPRGTEKVFIQLGNHLARLGHNVTQMTRKTKNKRNMFPISKEVKIKEIPTFRYYESLTTVPFYFYEYFKERFDVVVIAFAKYGEAIPLWFVSKFTKTKYFIRFAYSFEYQPYRYKEFDFPPIGKDATGLIAVSNAIARGVEKYFGSPCNVLPQAVETNYFQPTKDKLSIRKLLNIPHDAKVILSVSAIEERKGIQHAIKIISKIIKKDSNILLCVVGEGLYLEDLKDLTNQNRLNNNVRFFGHRSDVVRFYQASDLYAMFSDFEPNPNTIYEALACGVPVVTNKSGCFPEIVKDSWGKKIDLENIEKAGNIIMGLLYNKERLYKMGIRGREYVVKNHTWQRMAQEFLEIINEID